MIDDKIKELTYFRDTVSEKKDPLSIIMSTRYRKSSADTQTRTFVQDQLDECLARKTPIKLLILMGGFKQCRLVSAPAPDWSEVFNIHYILRLAHEINAIYPYGVEVVYMGNEFAISQINNYLPQDIDLYVTQFKKILRSYRKVLAPGISLDYITNYPFDTDNLLTISKQNIDKYRQLFNGFDEKKQQDLVHKSFRNIKWNGIVDLSNVTESEKLAFAKKQFLLNWAFVDTYMQETTDIRKDYINISFRRGLNGALHYGSCSSSAVQFWAGTGVFQVRDNNIHPWILSPEQYHLVRDQINRQKVRLDFFHKLGLSDAYVWYR